MQTFKKILLLVLLVFFTLMVVGGCGSEKKEGKSASAPAEKQTEEKITLKFASPFPATHTLVIDGDQYFIKRVQELTKERVEFKYYPAEQLGKAKDLLDLVSAGTADIAHIPVVYVSGKAPLSGALELPGLFNNLIVANKAALELTDHFYELEYKKLGVKPLAVFVEAGMYDVHTVKKPIKSIKDLKGLKIRVAGGAMEEVATYVGAMPVTLPSMELYETLQRGIVDGLFFPHLNCEPYKLNEILKYATVGANFGSTSGLFGMNEASWRKLPEDVQKAIIKAARESIIHLSEVLQAKEESAIKKAEQQGKVMYYLTSEEQKEWADFLKPTQEKWVKTMEQRGLPAQQVVEMYRKALKEAETR